MFWKTVFKICTIRLITDFNLQHDKSLQPQDKMSIVQACKTLHCSVLLCINLELKLMATMNREVTVISPFTKILTSRFEETDEKTVAQNS